MRSSFDAGAVSMATTVQGTPALRAAYATPCPAFPALIVQTPRFRASSESAATALAAPRSLYALMGWRFSSLSQISGCSPPSSRRTSGVRTMTPAMRLRAASMASNEIGCTGSSNTAIAVPLARRIMADFTIHHCHHHADVLDSYRRNVLQPLLKDGEVRSHTWPPPGAAILCKW